MGACRHGDRCSRAHNQPVFSQTICLVHLYQNPMNEVETAKKLGIPPPDIDRRVMEEEFLNFYEEVHEELSKFGEIDELNVCDNLGDHMIGPWLPCCCLTSLLGVARCVTYSSLCCMPGNVYVKYYTEEDAMTAKENLNGRFYAGRHICAEFSPVTEFREARYASVPLATVLAGLPLRTSVVVPWDRAVACHSGDFPNPFCFRVPVSRSGHRAEQVSTVRRKDVQSRGLL
jgi:splicing factor U2AF subunit